MYIINTGRIQSTAFDWLNMRMPCIACYHCQVMDPPAATKTAWRAPFSSLLNIADYHRPHAKCAQRNMSHVTYQSGSSPHGVCWCHRGYLTRRNESRERACSSDATVVNTFLGPSVSVESLQPIWRLGTRLYLGVLYFLMSCSVENEKGP